MSDFTFNLNRQDGNGQSMSSPDKPEYCPVCGAYIAAHYKHGFLVTQGVSEPRAETVWQCAKETCLRFFIAEYTPTPDGVWRMRRLYPKQLQVRNFSDNIKLISKDFIEIYGQAEAAEHHSLELVAGPGYRKALEFLIKDYCIQQDPSVKTDVTVDNLAAVIKKYVKDERVKNVAARATWLGNDETHYTRKWEDKDLTDLKKMIDMTVHWMDMEADYKHLLVDMPDPNQSATIATESIGEINS